MRDGIDGTRNLVSDQLVGAKKPVTYSQLGRSITVAILIGCDRPAKSVMPPLTDLPACLVMTSDAVRSVRMLDEFSPFP